MRYVLAAVLLFAGLVSAQDKGTFRKQKESFYTKTILPALDQYDTEQANNGKRRFSIDMDGKSFPTNPEEYQQIRHIKPVSQGNTGTCWCFSTVSFFESEVLRTADREVKLSEMYVVYWQYVERAKYFVQHRGNMSLGEGSEANAATLMIEKYGIVPRKNYEGKPYSQPFYSHEMLFKEIEGYLAVIKQTNAWNEEQVVVTVRAILDHYLGAPPQKFKYNNIDYTPASFRDKYAKIETEKYVNFISLMEHDYNTKAEYDVPDNWWNSDDYWNVSLDDFMKIVETSVKNGFGVAIGGDVSEIGLDRDYQVAIVPSFDIPSKNIDESARQFRFSNRSTTDDHAMHIVGIKKHKGANWYLVKDSGSGSRTCGEGCNSFGYYFFHEDYIKLKIMNITVHEDAVKDLLDLDL